MGNNLLVSLIKNTLQNYCNIKPDLSFTVKTTQKEQVFVFGTMLELY